MSFATNAKARTRGTLRHSLKNGYLRVSCLLHKLESISLQTGRIILYFTPHELAFTKIWCSEPPFRSEPQIWPQICSMADSTSPLSQLTPIWSEQGKRREVWLGQCGWPLRWLNQRAPGGPGQAEVKGWVTGRGTCVDAQSFGSLHQLRQPAPCFAHQDSGGQSHATLSRCPERCTHKLVQSVLLVGIRHHHTMVFGSL